MSQQFFQIIFIATFLLFWFIRAYYQKQATQTRGEVEFVEGQRHTFLRRLLGVPFMLALLAFMIRPQLFSWAQFPLPEWGQWLGAAFGALSLPLIWWVQSALGSNFSSTLHIRQEHSLVTHGPYHWVRHPMYTTLFMHEIAILLLTRNWFIGGFFLAAQAVIVATRLSNEEDVMIERFGDDYRQYMRRTGRFLPKLSA